MPRVRPALQFYSSAQGSSQVTHWRVGLSLPSLWPSFWTGKGTAGSYPTIARAAPGHQSQVDDQAGQGERIQDQPLDAGWCSCSSRRVMSTNTRNGGTSPFLNASCYLEQTWRWVATESCDQISSLRTHPHTTHTHVLGSRCPESIDECRMSVKSRDAKGPTVLSGSRDLISSSFLLLLFFLLEEARDLLWFSRD